MILRFQLSSEDSAEARRISAGFRPLRSKVRWISVMTAGLALVGGLVLLILWQVRHSQNSDRALVPSQMFFLFFALALVFIGWSGLRRGVFSTPREVKEQTIVVDDVGIAFTGFVGTKKSLPWRKISAYTESEKIVVLFSSWFSVLSSIFAYKYPAGFLYVIPKRAFTPDQLEQFRAYVERNKGVRRAFD
jgi:hypothetical protein